MSDQLTTKLETLYKELPEVTCKSCGWCCVSPTCLLSEFLYMMVFAKDNLTENELKELIHVRPAEHPHHEGNYVCIFQKENLCSIHPARPGACRLFGLPIHCWLEIYFDQSLDLDIFTDIRRAMHDIINLLPFAEGYKFYTGIKEKISKIDILYSLLDSGDKETLRKILLSLINDYPMTGTYYHQEANVFLKRLESSLKDY